MSNSGKNVDAIEQLRCHASSLISQAGDLGRISEEVAEEYRLTIKSFLSEGGSRDDLIVKIGECFFPDPSIKSSQGPHEEEPLEGSVRLDFDYLENFMVECFLAIGVPEAEARVSANVLIEADKRGIDSHGIGRLKPIYFDRIAKGILKPHAPIDVVSETATTAMVDGNLGLGLYIGPHCMNLAIEKAKTHGVGFVVARNSTHYGIAGYYATMATERGCIGLTGTNARPSIAPTFGVQPCMGTNPLTFGIPTDEPFPFVIDCATSINQRGKIEKYARLGQATPKGMVIDNDGNERTDTEGILRDMVKGLCALCPLGGAGDVLGGYKGYGWAAVVEILSIAFQSGDFGSLLSGVNPDTGAPRSMPLGHFFLAIDVEAICSLNTFKRNTGEFLRFLRESKKDPTGPGRIWTAGEPEWDSRQYRTAAGGVMVPPALLQDMRDLRESLPGIKTKFPVFPFE